MKNSTNQKNWSVKKFGGTSLKDPQCIANVATLLESLWKKGERFAVVVSAMAGTTNTLNGFCQDIKDSLICHQEPEETYDAHRARCYEKDVVLTAGEQINAGLLAMALQYCGLDSRSFLSWQLPIYTNNNPTQGEIQHIHTEEIENLLNQGVVPIITGFQGITKEGRLTTLGRGGSDTTAVALSAFLKAKTCDIYTDVRGIYTADPSCVDHVQQLRDISYEDMAFLSQGGAKVMHPHGVYWAKKHNIDVRILSTFNPDDPGTCIHNTSYKAWGVAKKTLLHWTIKGLTLEELTHYSKELNKFWIIDMKMKKAGEKSKIWTLEFCSHGENHEEIRLIFPLNFDLHTSPIHFITVLSPWHFPTPLSSSQESSLWTTFQDLKGRDSHGCKSKNSKKKQSKAIQAIDIGKEYPLAEKEQMGMLFGRPVRYFSLNYGQGFGFFSLPEESSFIINHLHHELAQGAKRKKISLLAG